MKIENRLIKQGKYLIAGVDEVGRGALAGPVLASAVLFDSVILEKAKFFFGSEVKDSKLLSPGARKKVFKKIVNLGIIGVGKVSNKIIDKINILEATRLAMKRALLALSFRPDIVLVDGNIKIEIDLPQKQIIHGDRICFSISAASIVAKVLRDRIMEKMDKIYTLYNFKSNKGYGTKEHFRSLYLYGPSLIHRRSFRPINEAAFFKK